MPWRVRARLAPPAHAPARKPRRGSNLRCAWNGYDGVVDGDGFTTFVRQRLVLTLAHGDIVVMDNASIHKVDSVRDTIESARRRLIYLPPFSPDLNPTDLVWSLLKQQMMKKRATRTVVDWFDAASPSSAGPQRRQEQRVQPFLAFARFSRTSA